MDLGDTFIPKKFDYHLWIIITDPSIDPVVIVNLTTLTLDEEHVCILDVGDHPFIKHKTAVRYSDAKSPSVGQIEKALNNGDLRQHQPASPELLEKIWLGAALSTRIPPLILEILEERGVLPD